MHKLVTATALATMLATLTLPGTADAQRPEFDDWGRADGGQRAHDRDALRDWNPWSSGHDRGRRHSTVEVGPRPYFLVDDMRDGPLKRKLQQCFGEPVRRTSFTIGHRGAPLQFPEHTKESYEAAYRMGAGVLECDVTFTKDKALVCRHSQNDLATTTNILMTDLASRCHQPFVPAVLDADGEVVTPAQAECRTSDVTLAEFKTLRGRMETSANAAARTPKEFLSATPAFRTDLYSGPTSGTLMSHAESIELFRELGVDMTPELKAPAVAMPFDGFSQQDYAQELIDEYEAAGVRPRDVWPQSFRIEDVLYWIRNEPEFGRQAVYLDDAGSVDELPGFEELVDYKRQGINIVAPPTFALLALDGDGRIVPSDSTTRTSRAGPASTSSRGRSSARACSPTATTASTTRRSMPRSRARATS